MEKLNLIQQIAIWVLPVIFGITLHEVSHGWVAYRFGDKTAYLQGRLTINPLKHVDLIGTIVVPFLLLVASAGFLFGWAKPVPVDARNLKNPKRDMAFVAAAGPLSNLLMAIFWAFILKLGIFLYSRGIQGGEAIGYMGQAGILINLVLAILNLIPIPPLDGSRIVASVLPRQLHYWYVRIEPFGFFILIGLLLLGVFQKLIAPPVMYLFDIFLRVFGIK